MTDLVRILPSFPVAHFAALLPSLEQHGFTATDLLALHPADIARQTQLPILDLKRLIAAIQASLVNDLAPTLPLAESKTPLKQDEDASLHTSRDASTAVPQDVHDTGTHSTPLVTKEQKPEDEAPVHKPSVEGDASPAKEHPPLGVGDGAELSITRVSSTRTISTLDDGLDAALGGGVPVGRISEFAGESGAGKTQFLLSLCLAVQLPPPHGLSKQALYISTESGLATTRLAQMLKANPILKDCASSSFQHKAPSLDNILSTVTPDLESQDHILNYQVPVLLSRHDIGLLVVDSVAANYRAEFERQGSSHGSNMATRSADLVRLGASLRDLARRHNIAVVVANQVADRFATPYAASYGTPIHRSSVSGTQESPLASRSMPPPTMMASSTPSSSIPFSLLEDNQPPAPPTLLLEHQQRWFTGWGDDPHNSQALKTPSLGLVWSTQLACRIALFKRPVYGVPRRIAAPLDANDDYEADEAGGATLRSWRRWMKVVFAPHIGSRAQGLDGATEFQITMAGLSAVAKKSKVR